MRRPLFFPRLLSFLSPLLCSLLIAQATSQATPQTIATAQDPETVVGGRVTARTEGPQRASGLAGASAELLEFRDLYRVLEQALPGGKPSEPVATDRADDRGFYDLSAPAYGRWTLRLSAPGKATDERTLIAFLPWEEHPVVALAERREVTVRVLDPEGRPVAGARVVGWPDADDPHHIETGLTGDDGRVILPAAEGSPLRLAAWAPGHAPAEEVDATDATAELRLRAGIPRRIEVRQGRGLPVPEALVLLGESGIPAGKTDEDGRLEIRVPSDEPLAVRVLASDLRSSSTRIEPAEPQAETSETPETPETSETSETPPPVRLDLEPLPVISGRVIDAEDRTPLAGVVLWAPDAGEGLTVSDRAGGYRLALPEVPSRTFRLTAVLPGYVPRSFPVEPEKANGPFPTLVLNPAAAVSGTVVDVEGEPVAGAEIEVLGRFRDRGLARSGARGRFLVPSLMPGGSARLQAEKPGYAPATVDIPLLEAGKTVAGLRVVLERGRSVVGWVVDGEDRPVAGAQARMFLRSTDSSPMNRFFRPLAEGADALSGTDGRFVIDHLADGHYDLRVEASGFAPAEIPGIEVAGDAAAGGSAEAPLDLGTVVLDSAVQLVGRVVDPNDGPLAGVQLRAMAQSRRWGTQRVDPSRSVTDAEGRFTLGDFRRGENVSVQAEHPGYATSRVSGVQVPVAEPLEIVLEPAAQIRGTVRDPEGRPVENAEIRVDPSGRSWGYGGRSDKRTDAEGRFTLSDVPPGEITVLAWAEGYLRDAMVHLDVTPGARLDGIEIVLTPGATVSGRVTGPDGEPVIRAQVGLLSQAPWGPSGGSVDTDGDGQYRLDGVPTGPHTFSVRHGDHPPAVKDLDVRSGDNRLDFRLETGSRVSGRVLDAGGNPVVGASVGLQPMNHGENRGTVSQSDGSFTLLGVPGGEYRVRGSHQELGEVVLEEPLSVRSADVTGIEVRFQGGTTIRGRILGLALDELASIEVRGFSEGGRGRWTRPDYEGSFALEDVAPGNWTIIAASSEQRVSEQIEVAEGVSEVEVTLEFRAGSALVGRIFLGSEPLRQGSVSVHSAATGSGSFGPLDHEGRFRIEGLEEGIYRLRLLGQRGVQHEQEVEVPTDGELRITLEPAQLRGRVVDSVTDEPISGVSVSLVPEGDDPAAQSMRWMMFGALLTDTRGVFRVPDVTAGRYRLILTKDGYSRTETPITIDAGASEPLELRLQPSPGLILQLSWAPGLVPSTWVQVSATGADGRIGLTDRFPVSASGQVRLSSLPPGLWEIQVVGANGSAKVQATSPGPVVPVTLIPAEG